MSIANGNMFEASMMIEGAALTFGESMTVRVACTSMLMKLQNADYRQALGGIGPAYEMNLRTILEKIGKGAR